MNETKSSDGGPGKGMRKAAHPLSGVGSSNPCRWQGEWLHHTMVLVFVR
jgi:hypothetical protein